MIKTDDKHLLMIEPRSAPTAPVVRRHHPQDRRGAECRKGHRQP